jgi:hypothetical protein
MKAGITGIGLWGHGFNGWENFLTGLETGFAAPADGAPVVPAPSSIPARERRRAPLTVKMAIEVIDQAAAMAGTPQHEMCSVFSSAMGDSHITDYMCRTLAGPGKLLSPTRFHNSVHNTPSGYWSIGAENRLPSTFVSGYWDSFSIALLESVSLALSENKATALVIYDVAFGQPLFDIAPISEDFAAAFIIVPEANQAPWAIEVQVVAESCPVPAASNAFLAERMEKNPAASALLLCELLALQQPATLGWPMGDTAQPGSSLELTITQA